VAGKLIGINRVVVNCPAKSTLIKTAEMSWNSANETVIQGEISCVRESMEVRGPGRGGVTYLANRNQVFQARVTANNTLIIE